MVNFRLILILLLFLCLAPVQLYGSGASGQEYSNPEHVREEVDILAEFFQYHSRNNNSEMVNLTYERLEELSAGNPLSYAALHKLLLDFEALGARERYNQALEIAEQLIEKIEQTTYTEFKAFVFTRYAQALLSWLSTFDPMNIFKRRK